MLNTVVEMDQADGLRQLMLNRSKRYISVSIPGSDFDRHKVFGLVRQAMNLRDVDEVSEALLTDIQTFDTSSAEIIICVNHTPRSITEAYGIIKTLRANADYLSVGIFVLAHNPNLDVEINLIGHATIQAVINQRVFSAHAAYTSRRLSNQDALVN